MLTIPLYLLATPSLFDNFRVTLPNGCGTAGTAVQQGTASAGEILTGGAPPAVSAPLTLRLRGGPASAPVLLVTGDPAATTIPLNLGACTIGIEVDNFAGAAVTPMTVADGGGQYSVDVPNLPVLCGAVFGFQYFWADGTPCGIAHTEGRSSRSARSGSWPGPRWPTFGRAERRPRRRQ